MTTLSRNLFAILVITVLGTGLVACGQSASAEQADHSNTPSHAAQQVQIRADPSGRLAWERAEYDAPTGDVTFIIQNPANLAHNFVIEGQGARHQTKIIQGGASERLTTQGLQPGSYQLICSLPGHHESGMIATLVVR
jgi:uncharacterized cupredoxin-like copper-binding protein